MCLWPQKKGEFGWKRTHEREDQSDLNATSQAVIRGEAPYLKGRFGGYLLDSGVRVGDEGEEEGRRRGRGALLSLLDPAAQ